MYYVTTRRRWNFFVARAIVIIVIVTCAPIFFGSCKQEGASTHPTATPGPPASTPTSGHNFLPAEVLAGLPVYPGSTPTTFSNSVSGLPFSLPLYASASRPGYQSACAQYGVQANQRDILSWYENELGSMGYRKYSEHGFSAGSTVSGYEGAFFLPSQPLVSVEVHEYDVPNAHAFELLVIYSVPLPKSPEENLPDDIESVTVTYSPGNQPTVKTITDSQTIMQLVNMVNSLPIRPDYFYTGGPSSGIQTIFCLNFHSQSKGDITVSDIIGFEETGVHVDNYPILEDIHGLLQEEVERILGIQVT